MSVVTPTRQEKPERRANEIESEEAVVRIMSVVGARPNFIKIAPFLRALKGEELKGESIESCLVHTGQHYDKRMSFAFFEEMDIPHPDIDLGVGSGSHAEQVGRTMMAFEAVVREFHPDWIVVVGDVNATCACSIVAKKEQVRLAHIEAGLRSFDLGMPEEINRMVADRLADMLFTTDEIASGNLRREGVPEEKICMVGNIMIDSLEASRDRAAALILENVVKAGRRLSPRELNGMIMEGCYALMTLHRPSNVDRRDILSPLVNFLVNECAADAPVIWPVHPRTEERLRQFGLWDAVAAHPNIILMYPIGYIEMLRLNMSARLVLTDSGGLQEECCVLGTPCLTMRRNTERPMTLIEYGGVSELAGNSVDEIRPIYMKMKMRERKILRPPLWDGRTAPRIVEKLIRMM
jgi:UDP-N-acetylglucosamine 2-epimerase (non-hydrolysing)